MASSVNYGSSPQPESWAIAGRQVSRRSAAQIGVVAANPNLTGGREHVHHDAVFQHLDAVRHVGGHGQTFAGAHDLLTAATDKPDRPALYHRDLLVDMAVFRHDATLLQLDPRDGDVLPVNDFAAKVRVHLLGGHRVPGLKFHREI